MKQAIKEGKVLATMQGSLTEGKTIRQVLQQIHLLPVTTIRGRHDSPCFKDVETRVQCLLKVTLSEGDRAGTDFGPDLELTLDFCARDQIYKLFNLSLPRQDSS